MSVIGFGGGTIITAGYGPVNERDAREAIQAAFEGGVRFFDTAEHYGGGRSEELIGAELKSNRSEVTLCTKGGVRYADPSDNRSLIRDASYDSLRRGLEGSLTRLQTDHVDVFLLHQFDFQRSPEEHMANLARLRGEGLARSVGFCNFGVEAFDLSVATGVPDYVEYSRSLLDRRYTRELRVAQEHSCTRITFGTYVHGLLSEGWDESHDFGANDWRGLSRTTGFSGTSGNIFFSGEAFRQNLAVARRLRAIADEFGVSLAAFALAIALKDPCTDVVLVGCRNAREVRDGLRALSLTIDASLIAQAEALAGSGTRPTENLLGQAPADNIQFSQEKG